MRVAELTCTPSTRSTARTWQGTSGWGSYNQVLHRVCPEHIKITDNADPLKGASPTASTTRVVSRNKLFRR
jgi:hypothetical protein